MNRRDLFGLGAILGFGAAAPSQDKIGVPTPNFWRYANVPAPPMAPSLDPKYEAATALFNSLMEDHMKRRTMSDNAYFLMLSELRSMSPAARRAYSRKREQAHTQAINHFRKLSGLDKLVDFSHEKAVNSY